MLIESKEMEFISSLEVEYYLANNEFGDEDYKEKVSNFLTPYVDQDLFANEYVREDRLVLTVETGNDEVLDSIDLCEATFEENSLELIKELNFINQDMKEKMKEIVRETDRFLFERLDNIENTYVGYRIKQEIPRVDNTMMDKCSIKCTAVYEFIGFNDDDDLEHWITDGYCICKKSDLEKVRNLI